MSSWRADRASFRTQLDNRGWEWPGNTPESTVRTLVERGLRGAALQQALADHSARELALASMAEQLPSPDNRIVPDEQLRAVLAVGPTQRLS